MRETYEERIERVQTDVKSRGRPGDSGIRDCAGAAHATHAENRDFQRSLIAVKRDALGQIRNTAAYDDEVVRKVESALDLEEARLNG